MSCWGEPSRANFPFWHPLHQWWSSSLYFPVDLKNKQNAGCKKIKSHQSKSCLLFFSEWMISIRASVYRGCTLKSGLWSWEIKVQHFSLSPPLLWSSTNTVSRSLQKAMAVMKHSVAVPLRGEGGTSAALYALLERWLSLVPPFTSQTTPKKCTCDFNMQWKNNWRLWLNILTTCQKYIFWTIECHL